MVHAGPGATTRRVEQLRAVVAEWDAADRASGVEIWAAPWTRASAWPVAGAGAVVVDLHGALHAGPGVGEAAQLAWCAAVARSCRGATLGLVGSEAELGFWSAVLSGAGVSFPLAVAPYVPGPKMAAQGAAGQGAAGLGATGLGAAGLGAAGLVVASPWIADPALQPMLEQARDWAGRAGMAVVGGAAAGAVGGLAMAAMLGAGQAGEMLLDLRQNSPAERVATPAWVLDALADGMPVLTTVDGPLGRRIAAAGAGRVLGASFEPPPEGAGAAAARLVSSMADAGSALLAAVRRAAGLNGAARAAWSRGGRPPMVLGPGGRVLVVSDEAETLLAVRVRQPLDALRARGAIEGYAVLHKGEVAFDTHPGPGAWASRGFEAIWVHRSADPWLRLALEILGRRFVYDIDDNLLASPGYRSPFHPVAMAATREFLRAAAVVSCATPVLAGLLGARLEGGLAERLVVAPNLAFGPAAPVAAGAPRAVVWASSDRPALMGSIGAVVRAVRDHCLAHGTTLVVIGAEAPEGLRAAGVRVEQWPVMPHAAYREKLRSLSPSILVCPLETGADRETQDFIDGKSDIKRIEALSDGLVGVFSRALPYVEPGLAGGILAENTWESWLAGLEAARAACLAPAARVAWPEERDAAGFGLAAWGAALERARLSRPLTLADMRAGLAAAAARSEALLPAEVFDEADYLANYEDVRAAVAAGTVPSGYAHYAGPGRAERRFARARRAEGEAAGGASGEAWWATLLHEIGRLEAGAAARDAAVAGFERRLQLRRALAGRGGAR